MHLNMEGTKHEKAVLVILAYIVGFTTGFIAFGITLGSNNLELENEQMSSVSMVDSANTEAVEKTNDDSMLNTEENMSSDNGAQVDNDLNNISTNTKPVGYEDGRLFSNLNGASLVLSIKRDKLTADQAASLGNQGLHDAIPNYLLSPDSNFIYFCEQRTTADLCNDLVFDVKNQTIHYVTLEGTKITSTAEEAQNAQWVDGKLTFSAAQSLDSQTPWLLTNI